MRTADVFSFLFITLLIITKASSHLDNGSSASEWEGLLSSASNDPSIDHTDEDHQQFTAGFSSLDGMLQWAIGHSDPATLKEKSNHVQSLSSDDIMERQTQIKDLMGKLRTPSDGELMKIAIADLNNSSIISLEDHQRALDELLILVEPIHNANDLDKLGGLIAVIQGLYDSHSNIRITSAWIIGKACQNNPLVQNQALGHGCLPKLMKMVKSRDSEEGGKALYAVSSLIRNNDGGQQIFYAENGELMVQDIISNFSIDGRLRKKAMYLVADLVDYKLEHMDNLNTPFFSNHLLLKSIVNHMSSSDPDLQEKALLAIRSLITLDYIEAVMLKDVCNLDVSLELMRQQLEHFMIVEDQKDFAIDMEILRRDVDVIFQKKLLLEKRSTKQEFAAISSV
ncbi:hypothetical protein ZOSMA_146G00620 [Zostera marina]|uniref:Nucleotide exchange factor Fes1 domain-containing protein n=1 Tax=Zostera marina TaxID=29655 RepID=A0A0K9PXB9_ZOSMR|nr:hypothetical protein ZOSMA_146G00620 [Zostera marina]